MYVRKEKTFKLLIFSKGRYYIYNLNKSTILDFYTMKYILLSIILLSQNTRTLRYDKQNYVLFSCKAKYNSLNLYI